MLKSLTKKTIILLGFALSIELFLIIFYYVQSQQQLPSFVSSDIQIFYNQPKLSSLITDIKIVQKQAQLFKQNPCPNDYQLVDFVFSGLIRGCDCTQSKLQTKTIYKDFICSTYYLQMGCFQVQDKQLTSYNYWYINDNDNIYTQQERIFNICYKLQKLVESFKFCGSQSDQSYQFCVANDLECPFTNFSLKLRPLNERRIRIRNLESQNDSNNNVLGNDGEDGEMQGDGQNSDIFQVDKIYQENKFPLIDIKMTQSRFFCQSFNRTNIDYTDYQLSREFKQPCSVSGQDDQSNQSDQFITLKQFFEINDPLIVKYAYYNDENQKMFLNSHLFRPCWIYIDKVEIFWDSRQNQDRLNIFLIQNKLLSISWTHLIFIILSLYLFYWDKKERKLMRYGFGEESHYQNEWNNFIRYTQRQTSQNWVLDPQVTAWGVTYMIFSLFSFVFYLFCFFSVFIVKQEIEDFSQYRMDKDYCCQGQACIYDYQKTMVKSYEIIRDYYDNIQNTQIMWIPFLFSIFEITYFIYAYVIVSDHFDEMCAQWKQSGIQIKKVDTIEDQTFIERIPHLFLQEKDITRKIQTVVQKE